MEPGAGKAERTLAAIIFEYLDNPALWPVLIAFLGHLAIVLAPLQRHAWVDHDPRAMVTLAIALAGTTAAAAFERRMRGRLGWLTVSLAMTWAVGAAVAYFALEMPFI